MATTTYTDVANNQRDGLNFPGGGLTTQPGQFNDPVLEGSTTNFITATYTCLGTEIQNDLVYIARMPAGSLVDPAGNVTSNGPSGSTLNLQIGDTDTAGGTVTADVKRYSDAIDIHTTMTAPLAFASGTTLLAPAEIVDDGAWLTAKFSTMTGSPTAGKVIIFRIKFTGNR